MQNTEVSGSGPAIPIAGLVVDSLEFARMARRLEFAVAVADLPRLAESVAGDCGRLQCSVQGELDQEGDAFLVLGIAGQLVLTCQRCLQAMAYPLQLENRLLLVPAEGAWPDEELLEDGFDAIEADRELALLPLIEDEVMLALPIAPCHETCDTPQAPEEANEPSPFAVLGKLKKGV
jgi:uncharacterized protein